METANMLSEIVQAAEDKKAQNTVILDIQGLSVVADYFVICSGNSETQVQSIVEAIKEKAGELGLQPAPTEGLADARWVLIDLGDVIAHVFHREEREYYNLEKLWSDARPVHVQNG